MPYLAIMSWKTYNGSLIETPIVEKVEHTLLKEKAKGHNIKICIGTDSQVNGKLIEYATVILFLREKKGGFMYIKREKQHGTISLRERMILEVTKSVDIAYQLCELLDRYKIPLEVHADINTDPHFKSNVAFKDAMGYIMGMGFAFKAKPDAFASSCCADKVV